MSGEELSVLPPYAREWLPLSTARSRSIALSSPIPGITAPLGTVDTAASGATPNGLASPQLPFAQAVAGAADRIAVFCGTWNMAEQSAPENIRDWIPIDRDIYAIGLQECMEARALRSACCSLFPVPSRPVLHVCD